MTGRSAQDKHAAVEHDLRAALRALCAGLIDADAVDRAAAVVSDSLVPEPFRHLLVHSDHMTTRLERHCGRPMALHVLASRRDGDVYRRMIVLTPDTADAPAGSAAARNVEFGIVRIDLLCIAPDVRREILEQRAPLGDILIRHNVLRRIQPRGYLRFGPAAPFMRQFGGQLQTVYGRIGVIHYDSRPAIELLEVVSGSTGTP